MKHNICDYPSITFPRWVSDDQVNIRVLLLNSIYA